jgi:hypothetical protein
MTQTLQNDLPLWRHSGWTARATAGVTKFGTVPIRPFASALAALKEEWTKNSGEQNSSS